MIQYPLIVFAGGLRVPITARRVLFRAGQTSTQFSGGLASGQSASYVLWATKGQLLEVRIDRVRGRDIVLRVLDEKSRTPVDQNARDGVR